MYPSSISYGASDTGNHPFEVRFLPVHDLQAALPSRSDRRISYQDGFAVSFQTLITSIEIFVQGNKKFEYQIDYISDDLHTRQDISRVSSIGYDENGVASTQDIEFTYFRRTNVVLGSLYHKLHLLRDVSLFSGGKITFEYTPSTQLRDSQGKLVAKGPYFPLQVVTAVTMSDFLRSPDRTEYLYRDGYFHYSNPLDRELSGFGRVEVIDPLGQKRISYFHQGGGFDGTALGESPNDSWYLIGKPYRTEMYDTEGRLRSENVTKWAQADLGADRKFPYVSDRVSTIYDTNGAKRSTAIHSQYDLSNGNMVESIEFGEVNAQTDGSYTDLLPDNRRMVMVYAENAVDHLLSFPKRSQLFDAAGTVVSQVEMIYDGLPFGQVQRGLVTQQSQTFFEENRQISIQSAYNAAGQLISQIDPRGNQMTISYDSSGIYPASITNAIGHTSQFEYDLMFGRALRTTNPNGLETEVSIDGLGRVLETRITDPNTAQLEQMTATEYLENSIPHGVKTTVYLDASRQADTYTYMDGFGRSIQTRSLHDNAGNYVVSNTIYDALGRVKQTTLPEIYSGVGYNGREGSSIVTSLNYDALGRKTAVTDANGRTIMRYSLWTTTTIDPNGNSKTTENDPFGRLIKVIEREGGQDFVTEYKYDERDLMIQLVDSLGNERNFVYDSLGRMVSQEDLHDPSDTDFGVLSYSYDDSGNVVDMTNQMGEVVENGYDPLNRMIYQQLQGDTSTRYQFSFDQPSGGAGAIGKLTSIQTPDHEWSGVYDLRGRLISETNTIAGVDYQKSYSYTRFDQPDTTVYPDGTPITREYDSIGQLKKVKTGAEEIIEGLTYSPVMQINEVLYGNGVKSTIGYDAAQMYRMTSKVTQKISTVWMPEWLRMPGFVESAVADSWLLAFSSPARNRLKRKMRVQRESQASQSPDLSSSEDTVVVPNEALEELFDDKSMSAQGTVTSNPLLQKLLNDGGFGFQDPVVNQDTGELEFPNSSSQNTVVPAGQRGKPTLNFLGDQDGNMHEVTGTLSLSALYTNTDDPTVAATAYQVGINKNGRFYWQDARFISLPVPLRIGTTSPVFNYDISQINDAQSVFSLYIRLQLSDGSVTPVSDPVTFRIGQSQIQALLNAQPSVSAPAIQLYQADGIALVQGDQDVLVGAQPSQPLEWQLSVQHDAAINPVQISFSPPLPSTFKGPNAPEVSHTPIPNGGGWVNDQIQIRWEPFPEQFGLYVMTIEVSDSAGNTSTIDVNIEVKDGTPVVAPSGDLIQQLSYRYDAVGNITQVTEQAPTPSEGVRNYVYDDLYRLKSTRVSNTHTRYGDFTREMSYDAVGNVLEKSDQGNYVYGQPGKTNPHAVTSISHPISGELKTFIYDDKGNLLEEEIITSGNAVTTKTYQWNHYNRMVRSEVVRANGASTVSTYQYDHSGRRIRKQVEDIPAGMTSGSVKTTVYPFSDFELTDVGNTKVSVMAGSLHVGTVEYDGGQLKIYYSHTDHLGGGNILTNEQGNFAQSLDYFPFGSVRADEQYEAFDERLKFTGHELDESTGLYYAQARYYHSDIGRFVSQDPLQMRLGELMGKFILIPQAFNYYSYSINSPITLMDPTGEGFFRDAWDAGKGVAVGMVSAVVNVAEEAVEVMVEFVDDPVGVVVDTAKGVKQAVSHPVQTAKQLKQDVADHFKEPAEAMVYADNYEAGKIYGEFAGELIIAGVGATKSIGSLQKTVRKLRSTDQYYDLVKQIQNDGTGVLTRGKTSGASLFHNYDDVLPGTDKNGTVIEYFKELLKK